MIFQQLDITRKKFEVSQKLFQNQTQNQKGTLAQQMSPSKSMGNLLTKTNTSKNNASQISGLSSFIQKGTLNMNKSNIKNLQFLDTFDHKLKHSSTHANLLTKGTKMKSFQQLSKCNLSLKNAFNSYGQLTKISLNNKDKQPKYIPQSSLDSHLNSFIQEQENMNSYASLRAAYRAKTSMHTRVGSMTSFTSNTREQSKDYGKPPIYVSPNKLNQNALRHSYSSQNDLSQRLMNHKERIQHKIAILQEEQEEAVMKECSFTPHFVSNGVKTAFSKKNYSTVQNSPDASSQLNENNKSMSRRNPQQFYEDQIQYQEKTMKKLINIFQDQLVEEQKEMDNKVLVCKGSEKIIQQKRAHTQSPDNVYDRLYKRSQERPEVQLLRNSQPEFSFQPQILTNNGILDRNQKVEEILYQDAIRRQHQRRLSLESQSDTNLQQQIVLPKSEEYLQQPFEREFRARADQLFGDVKDIQVYKIDLKQTENLMVNLGFIKDNSDRIELMKLWEYLGGNEQAKFSTIYLDKLLNTLLYIQNIKGKGDYKECRKIHYKFQKLFKNRENYINELKRKKIQEQYNNEQTKKENQRIQNPVSIQINNRKEQENNKKRHDVLLEKGQIYMKKKQDLSLQYQEEQVKGCTFKPQTLAKQRSPVHRKPVLNDISNSTIIKNANVIPTLQEAFQKTKQEKTQVQNKKKNDQNKENQQINANQNKKLNQQEQPIVYLDIHLNKNQVERITLYKGQNPDEVIQRFAMKNYLTNTDVQMIRQALQQQNSPERNKSRQTTKVVMTKENSHEISFKLDNSKQTPKAHQRFSLDKKKVQKSSRSNSPPSRSKPTLKLKTSSLKLDQGPLAKRKTLEQMVGELYVNTRNDEQLEVEDDKDYVPTIKEKYLKTKLMMHHNNKFIMNWDLFVMILALYNCISIPFTVAFEPETNDSYTAWERVIDVCFGIDILFNFRTTFINEKTGFEISDNKRVALNYIKSGRFFVDLAASIPFELLLEAGDSGNASKQQFKLFGLLKLVRLLRLGRIIRYMKIRQGFKLGMRLIQLLFGMFMLVHWVACIWYLIVRNPGDWIPPKDVAQSNPGDDITKLDFFYTGLDLIERYSVVFYYAILTMTGNEVLPMNILQTVVASIIIIIGAIVSTFIFGNMAAIMASLNKKSNQFDAQMDLVNSTMRQMRLPEDLQDQVLNFMMHLQNSPDLHQDLEKFFLIVNEPLRKQILYHLHGPLLTKVHLMSKCSSVEQSFFICNLKPVLFLPTDTIMREGETGDNMYFVNKGEVQIIIRFEREIEKDQKVQVKEVFRILKEGDFFGEVAILTRLKRSATVKSTDYSSCAFMTREDLQLMESHFPHIVQQFRMKIKDYQDPKMHFRRLMIQNLHYMRHLGDEVINEMICCLQVKRYAEQTNIIKSGDGSAFCAYTFISDEAQQLQTFRAKTNCIVESISRDDLRKLSKKFYQLADQLDMIREKLDENETDFDFFRYRPPRKELSENLKSMIRRRFRQALCRFYQKYRYGEAQLPEALVILKQVQADRAKKIEEINKLRTQALALQYGGGYGEQKKFTFAQLAQSQVNTVRSSEITSTQSSELKVQSQLLTQSVLLAQENLKKQNQLLLEMIDEFSDKYTLIKEKFSQLKIEMDQDLVDDQLEDLKSQADQSETADNIILKNYQS